MKYTVNIPEEYIDELKDSYFEMEAYKDILTEVAIRDVNCETTNLEKMADLYKKAMIRYTSAKAELELGFINKDYPRAYNWTIYFGDNTIVIETKE